MAVQPKLLRALEERTVTPVGSTKTYPFDVRIIAASHVNLLDEVDSNTFRGPLYARLAEVSLSIPPLRDRREDILILAMHHLKPPIPHLSARLIDALLRYDWPFNVRELVKVTTELGIRGAGLKVLDLNLVARRLGVEPESVPFQGDYSESRHETTMELEAVAAQINKQPVPTKEELESLLQEFQGNISRLAEATGRSRRQVHRWLNKYDLEAEDFRQRE